MTDISAPSLTGSTPTLGTAVDPVVQVTPGTPEPVSKPGSAAHRIESDLLRSVEVCSLDAEKYDCSPSNVAQVISKMESYGYRFERRTDGKFTYCRLTYVPTPEEVAERKRSLKTATPARKPRKATAKAAATPPAPREMVLPGINESLRVSLIKSDAKGNIRLGLTDEKRTWLVSVSALALA